MTSVRYSDPTNLLQTEYDAEIAADAPVIVWSKNHHGVMVGIVVKDPHADCPNRKPKRKKA